MFLFSAPYYSRVERRASLGDYIIVSIRSCCSLNAIIGNSAEMIQVLQIGDSDIALWPCQLLPSLDSLKSNDDFDTPAMIVSGHSGATLDVVVAKLRHHLSCMTNASDSKEGSVSLLVVACAGENDIGSGVSLDASVASLRIFLDLAFSIEETIPMVSSSTKRRFTMEHLIFLGPKFEPWLEDDPSLKKKYSKMSRSFARCCSRHVHSNRIHYIDCLTMFCGESGLVPGATLAGRASAEEKYFEADRLHLSLEGYKIWKEVVERHFQSLEYHDR